MNDLKSPTANEQRRFTLPCGCVAVTEDGGAFKVQWCPHHSTLHGVLPVNFAKESRAEQRAYR